ncbi:cell death regulator Aven [Tamandua tetradactyla]|uniref:cell death regulator Aven n=1 Tax=Tamandua tetradactyla TaxID=48850 RepID=UPI004053D570
MNFFPCLVALVTSEALHKLALVGPFLGTPSLSRTTGHPAPAAAASVLRSLSPTPRGRRGPIARGFSGRPVSGGAGASLRPPGSCALSTADGGQMQAERGGRGGRGRRPYRDRPGGDRDPDRAEAAAVARDGGGDRGGRRARGRGFRGGRGGRGGGAPRGGRREQRGRGAGTSVRVEDDSNAESNGEEEEQGSYSKRKIVSNWDRYQEIEKEVDNESGESQRGTDFSVLLSSAGDSFSQFRFAEEKEWDGETTDPKQNSALYVNCESLVQALQELPLSLRLNVAAELVQTTIPSELPQVKPKRNDNGKGLGMQLKGPLGPGGKGSASELKSMYLGKDRPRLGPSNDSQKPSSSPPSVADHLDEELDLLLNLDGPGKEEAGVLPHKTSLDLKPEEDRKEVQGDKAPAEPAVTEEKNVEAEQRTPSKSVTEEELEDWLDSMIS